MGQCVITIHVTGAHHNGRESDIEQRALQFVRLLKQDNHNVTAAHIANGAEQDLTQEGGFLPIKECFN